jgi:anti-sigma factor RsiW
MTPDKFFDYLEGKLPPTEKERLERALISDPELQREFATAREIHRGMQRSPNEETDSSATRRAGTRGRQVAAAFAVLVAMNVAFGLLYIFRANQPSKQVRQAREASLRHQLQSAVEKSADAVFTPPTIGTDRVFLTAPRAKQDDVAASIIAAATRAGGSGTKALPNDDGFTVLVLVPVAREQEFRNTLATFGAPSPTPSTGTPSSSPNDAVRLEIVISAPR